MKRVVKLVLGVALATVVAGCSVVSQAGAAAVVGGERLTNDVLSARFAEVKDALGTLTVDGTDADINRQIISSFIMGQVIDRALSEAGVEVTAGDIAAQRQQLLTQLGSEQALEAAAAQSAIPASQIDATLKISLGYQALVKHFLDPEQADPAAVQQDAERATLALVSRIAAEAGVEVSPRFGTWDSENLMMLGGGTSDVLITTEQLAQLAAGSQ